MGLSLDVGCGHRKTTGAIGVDRLALEGVDVVVDLDEQDLPFRRDVFEQIVCNHVLEHVRDCTRLIDELYRVAAPGAVVTVRGPAMHSAMALADPTHVRQLTS